MTAPDNGRLTQAQIRKMEVIRHLGFSLASKSDVTLLALERRGYVTTIGPNKMRRRWVLTPTGKQLLMEYTPCSSR